MFQPLDLGESFRIDVFEPAEIAGKRAGFRFDGVAAQIFEEIVVRVHAVERGVGRMRLVEVSEQVVDEVRQWFGNGHGSIKKLRYRAVELAASTIRQWYNKISVFHARHAVRGRHAYRQPRRHHGPGAARAAGSDADCRGRHAANGASACALRDRARQRRAFTSTTRPSKSVALVARLARGESIALVSDAGTPTVSDPGVRLIRAAIDAGVRVEPVPGPSAALDALAASGLPSDTFLFLGFPPIRSKARAEWLDAVGKRGTNCRVL